MGHGGLVQRAGVRLGRVHRLVHPGQRAVLGQRRADVQQPRAPGAPPSPAATRRASTACAAGRAAPTSTQCSGQQPQTCDATGTWGNTGAACSNRRASAARARACAHRGRCSAPASSRRRAAPRARGERRLVHEPGVRERRVHRRVHPRHDAVLGQRRADVPVERPWGSASACTNSACVTGACTGVCTPGAVQCSGNGVQTCSSSGPGARPPPAPTRRASAACAPAPAPRPDDLLGQRRRDVQRERRVRGGRRVHQPGVRGRRVHRRLHAGRRAVLGNGVQTCQSNGQWGTVDRVHELRLRRGGLHGHVLARAPCSARATACRPAAAAGAGAPRSRA